MRNIYEVTLTVDKRAITLKLTKKGTTPLGGNLAMFDPV